MKKALVMLLVLALVGGLVFAQDIVYKTAPTLSGYGQVTWGVNFNDTSTGFVNAGEIKLNVPLVSNQGSTHTGDAIYGEVAISDLELDFGTDATQKFDIASGADITAKILLPNSLYVTVYTAPGFTYNNAKSSKTYINDSWDDNRGLVKAAGWTGNTGGLTFGMSGDFNFALKVASVGAYNTASTTAGAAAVPASAALFVATGLETSVVNVFTTAGAAAALPLTAGTVYIRVTPATAAGAATAVPNNIDNLYGIGADVGYKVPDLLTVTAGLAYGPFSDTAATGLTLKVALAPKDTGLTANVAMDLAVSGAATPVTGMDIAADVAYALANVMTASASVYYGDADLAAVPPARLDAGVRLALTAVPNLNFDLGVDMWGLMDDPANDPMLIYVGTNVGYKIMQGETNYVKPFATIGYALDDANLYAKLGAEAVLFPKGVITAQYAAGGNPANNQVTATTNAFSADDYGTFTLSCKVSY